MSSGFTRLAAALAVIVAAGPISLLILSLRPDWFAGVVNGIFALVAAESFYSSAQVGGLLSSGLNEANNMLIPLTALLIFGRRAALFWFGVFVVSILYAANISTFVDPTYEVEPSVGAAAETLISIGIIIMVITLYFVRQRDRFQQESDDLLHNILPDEIATRLKTDTSMIADDFPQASVFFADVVGFTPMSATMTPPQLVGLLNDVFSKFDEFVEELGLEKIKTIGDEYMVASGVPVPRDDHAEAIAELALRIRDHMAGNEFNGHHLELRIGIHSGPVVAGIIGTHKFAYDLWGDTVNTASRMESGGIPGRIQVTPATYDLLAGNGYTFEPRGTIEVKGKGPMNTWLLVDKT
jgi:class 3 adenylate cyclase